MTHQQAALWAAAFLEEVEQHWPERAQATRIREAIETLRRVPLVIDRLDALAAHTAQLETRIVELLARLASSGAQAN